MNFGALTNPEETYEKALSKPNVTGTLINVTVAGIASGLAVIALSGNAIGLVGGTLVSFAQWFALTIVLWILYIMFKKKKTGDLDFDQIGAATGELWVLVIAMNTLILAGALLISAGLLAGIIGTVMFLLMVVIGIVTFYSHYKLIKTMFSANKGRHIIVWVVSIFISGIVSGTIISLINFVL